MNDSFPKSFRTNDGLELSCSVERPVGHAKAKVLIVHGLGDHSRALPYKYLKEFLSGNEVAAYSFDMRGHGHSGGRRMFSPTWEQVRRDLNLFIQLVRNDGPSVPLFLFGVSLGGLIVLDQTIHHPDGLRGVIVIAPALTDNRVPRFSKLLLRLMSHIAPTLAIDPKLELRNISRDDAALAEYTNDNLFQTKTTARFAGEVFRGISETCKLAGTVRIPILMLHGEADEIVPSCGSVKFFDDIVFPDKELLIYPGAFHNLLIEPDRDTYFSDTLAWIRHRL